jgi:hypothetical protein
MKKISFSITTTPEAFCFGFVWGNSSSHRWRATIIVGFLMFNLYWNK